MLSMLSDSGGIANLIMLKKNRNKNVNKIIFNVN